MPHIDITMYPGRSEELKAELAKNVRDCAAETLKMDKKYFSVSIEEVDKDKWEEHFKKYEGNLYEKPNYWFKESHPHAPCQEKRTVKKQLELTSKFNGSQLI